MGVNHRGTHITVPQQLLYGSDVVAVFKRRILFELLQPFEEFKSFGRIYVLIHPETFFDPS